MSANEEEGNSKRDSPNVPRRLGEVGRKSSNVGVEQDEASDDASEGRDNNRKTSKQGQESAGGILSQLRKIKKAHLQYVNAHSERLKARLAEDEIHRKEVIEEIAALEFELIAIGLGCESEEE
ncbi:MAG: hypothetical protein F6K45_07580 [Kamptonema sp. SIO1D9]|nr:hypothetical protein [Kamptonema sp. SIO1D9]